MSHTYCFFSTLLACGTLMCASAVQSAGINDTGITTFANNSQNNLTTEPPTHPGQDASRGRDAASVAGSLNKTGAGTKGFDFTKIANDGSVLPDTAVLGSGSKDWACTKDNVTGLIWEIKATDGLRSFLATYSWYSANTNTNAGWSGTESNGNCPMSGRCDTAKYVEDVNGSTLCSRSHWRMPSLKELQSLLNLGRANPAIDLTFFPNTITNYHWTTSSSATTPLRAWYVYFGTGQTDTYLKSNAFSVRLVHDGP